MKENALDSDGSLCNVSSNDDLPSRRRVEDPFLFCGRELSVEGHDLDWTEIHSSKGVDDLGDLHDTCERTRMIKHDHSR